MKKHRDSQLTTPPFRAVTPERVLYFAPVVLSLLLFQFSMLGSSVFYGFNENQPGSWLSVTLMGTAFLISFTRISRLRQNQPGLFRLAIIICTLAAVGIIDELFEFHETLGLAIQPDYPDNPDSARIYYDDFIVIIASAAGFGLLLLFIRKLQILRRDFSYLISVFALAMLHGVLDIFGHRKGIIRILLPDLTVIQSINYSETISFFEEFCKIWCEWFLIIWLFRVFFNTRGYLYWSWFLFLASLTVFPGLWQIDENLNAVPFLVLNGKHEFLRNYHLLFSYSVLWVFCTFLGYKRCKENDRLLLFIPIILMLPIQSWIPGISRHWIADTGGWILLDSNPLLGVDLLAVTSAVLLYYFRKTGWGLIVTVPLLVWNFHFSHLLSIPEDWSMRILPTALSAWMLFHNKYWHSEFKWLLLIPIILSQNTLGILTYSLGLMLHCSKIRMNFKPIMLLVLINLTLSIYWVHELAPDTVSNQKTEIDVHTPLRTGVQPVANADEIGGVYHEQMRSWPASGPRN